MSEDATAPDAGDSGPVTNAAPLSAGAIADQVRPVLETSDLDALGALLSPDVRWAPPGSAGPPRRTPEQALAWYANALRVGQHLEDGQERWQVLRVGPDGINDIPGLEDRCRAAL